MNALPSPESAQVRMQQLRCKIDGDMEDVAASARRMVDWKRYVKTHPWLCLGAVAALGLLIVLNRPRTIRPDVATPTELAKTGHLVVTPAPAATRGWIAKLLATVANMALRKAIASACRSVGRLLRTTGQPRTGHHDVHRTS